MTMVRRASDSDLPFIRDLCKRETDSVGFIPLDRYQAELDGRRNGRLYIAEENGEQVGFAMATFGDVGHIQQIAIREDARLAERGAALVSAVEAETLRRGVLQVGCRVADDLEARHFWSALGFQWVRRIDPQNTRRRTISYYRKPVGTSYLLIPVQVSA